MKFKYNFNNKHTGKIIYKLCKKIFPICRSLTGKGNRETLNIFKKILPKLKIYEIKTGKKVFDWKVPNEWNIKDAYVKNSKNKKIIDFKKNNLHLVSYSIPVNKKMNLKSLKKKIHVNQKLKHAIPYVCSYYKKDWGFCLSYNDFKKLKEDIYHVKIDSSLKPGSLTYADILIKGKKEKEILFSSYICHPSLANNEASGPSLALYLAKYVSSLKNLNFSYRFVFSPENIGSIIYINKNLKNLKKNVVAAYNITCVGDNKNYSYLSSKFKDSLSDRIALRALKNLKINFKSYPFLEFSGSDERRYCSPGVDIPMCSIMRSKYGSYKEYHSSLDNLSFISAKGLEGSFKVYTNIIKIFENDPFYEIKSICEPQLGKRNLYPTTSKWPNKNYKSIVGNLTSVLSLADGKHDLDEMARKIHISKNEVQKIINKLKNKGLIK